MWNKQRREKLKAAPFPPDWSRILLERFPLYQRLPDADRKELQGHIQVFLAEKKLEGCGGLEITEEMKVCIAAQACLLLLHRNTDYYPGLRSILVYPTAYFAKTTRHVGVGVMEERFDSRLGEAWDSGAVVLAWDAVNHGATIPDDGHNVVFHEFAHQLDFEDGKADGAPGPWERGLRVQAKKPIPSLSARAEPRVRTASAETQHGQTEVLDGYGATNPAEFFAVATESFFELPVQMREKHPKADEDLKRYYATGSCVSPPKASTT